MRAEQLLPDHLNQDEFNGVTVRKGTVGAFLENARIWVTLSAPEANKMIAEHDIIDALPALRAIGIFDVFEIRDAALRKFVESN
ncbi:hypothetical protein [Paraburkholderia sediminicola]|uniref:hypothetical protein n=1 Tax=Paraburkholderia sediminicola TaxID=458836 RepID=UPI0038BDB25D